MTKIILKDIDRAHENTKIGKSERKALTAKRFSSERRFRFLGGSAVLVAVAFLILLLWTIIRNAIPAFTNHYAIVPLNFKNKELTAETLKTYDFRKMIRQGLKDLFPEVTTRKDKRLLQKIISSGASISVQKAAIRNTDWIGKTQDVSIPLSDKADLYFKELLGNLSRPESERKISDKEIDWLKQLKGEGRIESRWNSIFFTNGASREPEMAGIWGAVVGSFLTLFVTLILSFPVGVAGAIYLEEFSQKNRLNALIEVNINNLAAVPSIVFGLLGLGIFINGIDFGIITIGGGAPRSAALTGGMVLALMTLPTMIIASRTAIKSVPLSIREAAFGIGASRIQTVFHHVLPLAMPGIMTGSIIGMARALGETAPLLMIGMVAFIVDIPASFSDPATVLPVQIYMWADFPEIGFQQKTAAATLILLVFLVLMNGVTVWLRNKFERRW
ncbi:phosphate ABC transporter permease PstA [Candidatus Endowatersipora endosymbiont of Watersipora subatra]|uniref:phosphate ABC transporter permease PstA n=1 Tax=Candidatus Endowatersipora endosymbiont of Watersipora subatra TaxID=3077946 RepID=UPI00312CB00A